MRSTRGLKYASAGLLLLFTAACGKVENEAGSPTGTLCFDYFQRCVYPLALDTQLPVDQDNNGTFESTRRCSDSGCHNSGGSSGGGLRLTPSLAPVNAAMPFDQLQQTGMYVTFLSAKGRADLNDARQSALIKEPLFEVNHGGGRVFVSTNDAAARQILFWINNRVPAGGNEVSAFCATLFVGGVQGQCQP